MKHNTQKTVTQKPGIILVKHDTKHSYTGVALIILGFAMILMSQILQAVDEHRKKVYQQGYENGQRDGYWKSQSEHKIY